MYIYRDRKEEREYYGYTQADLDKVNRQIASLEAAKDRFCPAGLKESIRKKCLEDINEKIDDLVKKQNQIAAALKTEAETELVTEEVQVVKAKRTRERIALFGGIGLLAIGGIIIIISLLPKRKK